LHRVLVVEDEEPIARVLERWLKRHKVEVWVVHDTALVERALLDFLPTHVVSDLNMPLQDGLEVLAMARRVVPDAVRCLMSGSLDSLDKGRLARVQPVRLVGKPWNDATLWRDLGLDGEGL
jgi:two-component system, OmpR family, response regulator VicR